MPLRSHESTADQKPGKQISSALQASGEPGDNVEPIDTRTLDGALRAHLFERLASLGGKPVIQVSPAMRDLMQLTRPEYDFAIADRGDRMLGLVQFDVTIYRQGKVEQVRPVLAEVALVKPVVMAAGPINRGQTIQSKDVVIQDQTFDRPDRVGMTDLNAVVGQRAVRFMNKGEMLTAKEIEPVPFVVRNDLVTVTARRGSVTIKGVAKALSSASYGNTVELRNESSKQVFLATVTGPKTAELVMSGTVPAQAVAAAGGNQ
jgi:flagella basal body P-ring formation protein FlgA